MHSKYIKLILFLALPFISNATDYFVDGTNGSNENTGVTDTSAFKTIAKANSMVQPGDIVYILQGSYINDPIDPGTSGTADNFITYKNFPEHEVTLTQSYFLVNLSNTDYIIVEGLNLIQANMSWINMDYSINCIIQNVYCYYAKGYSGVSMVKSQYCKILNSYFSTHCDLDEVQETSEKGPFDLIWAEGCSYNLFEGNEFSKALHYGLDLFGRPVGSGSQKNIIRNNHFHNEYHGGLGIGEETVDNIVENNLFFDHGEEATISYCGTEKDREMARELQLAFQLFSNKTLVRNNVFVNNGRFTIRNPKDQYAEATDNITYNNVFYGHHGNGIANSSNLYRIEIINSAFGENLMDDISYSNPERGLVDNNNFADRTPLAGALNSLTFSNPLFVDKDNRDFHLQENSPLIDAGKFLTVTANTDSGKAIKVENPVYFTDGYSIIEGDLIQLEGQSIRARILSIDYNNRELYVDTYLKWQEGQGVSLAYTGLAPDVGAFEYGQGTISEMQARSPYPADGATNTEDSLQLKWSSGEGALSHNLYLGENSEVSFIANTSDSTYEINNLETNKTYYWRIDEITASDTVMGNIWSFTTGDAALAPEAAFREFPENSSENINVTTELTWKPGRRAESHDVYFGTSNPPVLVSNQIESNYTLETLALNTTYYWRIDERNDYGITEGSVWSFKTQQSTGLPEEWVSRDVGNVGINGEGHINDQGDFYVSGSGIDIEDKEDAFHFVYIPFNGDGDLIARVVSLDATDPDAKAGVMIREDFAASSKYAMIALTAENGITYQTRTTSGYITNIYDGSSKTAPYWLKIVKGIGKYYVGYESADGSAWKLIRNEEMSMADDIYIGLAVTSANNDSICTAVFDNLTLNGNPVSIEDLGSKNLLPEKFGIKNYPNPFNPTTNIQINLPETGNTSMTIYDISGRRIKSLLSGNQMAGIHLLQWDGTNISGSKVASGLYFYRVQFKKQVKTGKMVLIR